MQQRRPTRFGEIGKTTGANGDLSVDTCHNAQEVDEQVAGIEQDIQQSKLSNPGYNVSNVDFTVGAGIVPPPPANILI